VLGPLAADIVVMVVNAIAVLFVGAFGGMITSSGYETNPFNKPWQWVLLALFVVGFAGVLVYAKGA